MANPKFEVRVNEEIDNDVSTLADSLKLDKPTTQKMIISFGIKILKEMLKLKEED